MKQSNNHRLPDHVVPIRYTLQIVPDLENFTFSGSEAINIDIKKKTKEIVLHCIDIEINSAVFKFGKKQIDCKDVSYDKYSETVILTFATSLLGKGNLCIEFTGSINDKLHGFYRSKYTHDKKEKHLATTQFEATDARRAFPCFDEPSHKAIFDLSIVVPKNLQVVSNTQEKKIEKLGKDKKIVHFESTPKMSSYLLAYVIGELDHIKTKTKNGTVIKVHTTPGKSNLAAFSLETAKRSLEFLENYFGIKYPLKTLDLLAIPDFAAGAMENWGAITFRETALLVDEKHTSLINRQRVAEVIAHELVHQWFGNLVTMKWWTHLWLNESFACYMAYLVVDELFPEWRFWTKFVLSEQSYALKEDALLSTHPIEVEVKHSHEISEIFDGISYSKGASILRMISGYIGADNFRDALRIYLKKHSYGNTSSEDLWAAFDKVSNKNISALVKAWTQDKGYPVITITDAKKGLELSQKRFTLQKNEDKTLWQVPVQALIDHDKQSGMILANKAISHLHIENNYKFIKLNPNEQSFYITNYPIKYLALLVSAMQNKQIGSNDRLALIRNLYLLAISGYVQTDVYLEVVNQISATEDSYIVWAEISGNLAQIERVFFTSNKKYYESFLNWKKQLYANVLTRLGYNSQKNDTDSQKLLRSLAISNAGLAGLKEVEQYAKKQFSLYEKNKSIDRNHKTAILAVASYSDNKVLSTLFDKYKKATLQEERNQLVAAMLRTKGEKEYKQVLEFIFSGQVRPQDLPIAIIHGMLISKTSHLMWQEIKSRDKQLREMFMGGKLMGYIIEGARDFSTNELLKEFQNYAKPYLKTEKQSVAQTIEKIRINLAWIKRDSELVDSYFKGFAKQK